MHKACDKHIVNAGAVHARDLAKSPLREGVNPEVSQKSKNMRFTQSWFDLYRPNTTINPSSSRTGCMLALTGKAQCGASADKRNAIT